jgi:hypothetical protein
MSTHAEAAIWFATREARIAATRAQLLAVHLDDPVADAIYHALLETWDEYLEAGQEDYADIAAELAGVLNGALVPRS